MLESVRWRRLADVYYVQVEGARVDRVDEREVRAAAPAAPTTSAVRAPKRMARAS